MLITSISDLILPCDFVIRLCEIVLVLIL
uniref:Uncharacterized protein n=1 Tax=Lepeophtheirus salmonis TaxID=72036 RepID=A0A0K2T7T7_LEPSM